MENSTATAAHMEVNAAVSRRSSISSCGPGEKKRCLSAAPLAPSLHFTSPAFQHNRNCVTSPVRNDVPATEFCLFVCLF